MSIADQALWVMERNSEKALGLNDIAAACGVSRSHLANAFATAAGWPVMKYLKARRLTEAAHRLARGAPDILSVALEFGYGSHEAFTRAFRDQFGQTPEQVRSRGSVEGLATTPPLRLRNERARSAAAAIEAPWTLEVGRSRRALLTQRDHSYSRAMAAVHVVLLRRHSEQGESRCRSGMCEPPDDEGCFNYVCAAKVEAFGGRLPGLTSFVCEPRSYAVFAHNDHVSTIFNTYAAIWNEALPAMARIVADSPVLEFHNDAFDPDTGLGGLQLCIPLVD